MKNTLFKKIVLSLFMVAYLGYATLTVPVFAATSTSALMYLRMDTDGFNSVQSAVGNMVANVHSSASMPTFGRGKIGNGAVFPGTGSVAMESNAFTGTTDWGFTFWWNPTTIQTADVFTKDTVSGSGRVWSFTANSTNLNLFAWTSASGFNQTGNFASGMTAGTWYFWMATWDSAANLVSVYRDCVSVATITLTGNPSAQTGSAPIQIGTQYNSGTYNLKSVIDEPAYWGRALNMSDCLFLRSGGNPGIAQQYPFGVPLFWNWDF